MSPWLFALVMRRRVRVTETFTASRTWTAPLTTAVIESLTGEGADGDPGGVWMGTYTHYTITRYYDSEGVEYGEPVVQFDPSVPGHPPSVDYCDPAEPYVAIGQPPGATRQVCHYFYDDLTPATTGASTTAFGQTFVGGTGGAATPSTVTNVAITAGGTYDLVIPAGGSLSLTYYR